MATIQYGPGLALAGATADNTPYGIGQILRDFPYLLFFRETATQAIGNYSALNAPAVVDEFDGSGFTYDAIGRVTGGLITEFKRFYAGQILADLNFSSSPVPVTQLVNWVTLGQYALAGQTMFSGNDSFTGTTGNDTLQGYSGNDIYRPLTGHDTIIGSTGIDTVVLPDFVRNVAIFGSPLTGATVQANAISDSLSSVERLQFIDATRYYGAGSPAAQVVRMYDTLLGRAPDPVGLETWVASLNGGQSLTQMAAASIGSPEFQSRYPGASQNATAFVTQLYHNMLHRAPDSNGLSAWVGALTSGALTQAQVVAACSESAEHQSNMAPATNQVLVADETAASVARLYYSAFGRAPDATGLAGWINARENGSVTLLDEANAALSSPEFLTRYGNAVTAEDFVTLLYHNVLGRAPDAVGFAACTATLYAGTSRGEMLAAFSDSPEHVSALVPRIEAGGIVLG
jgi:TorA maturation chaperone TorD